MPHHVPKIDVHNHIIPEFLEELAASKDLPARASMPAWSVGKTLAFLDKHHIDTALLSPSAHGAMLAADRDEDRSLTRKWNEYAFDLRAAHPGRFGFLGLLPSLLDEEGVLAEIQYLFETLKADGVSLWTSYDGRYLGDMGFAPVFEALDKHHAVIHVHPNPTKKAPFFTTPFLPQPLIDFPHETSRTAADLVLSGRKRQTPNCKIILSHGGGTLPYLAERLVALSNHLFSGMLVEQSPRGDQIVEDLRSFYFDLALSGSKCVLDALLSFAPPENILYGSDFPFASAEAEYFDSTLEEYEMDDHLREMCYRENALRLFSSLQTPSPKLDDAK